MKLSRPLILGLCLALCAALSIGGTMAYFTDVVEVRNNIVEAGNLDIEILQNGKPVPADKKLFENPSKWEPGVVVYETLTIANVGTQAFNYTLTLSNLAANTVTVPDDIYTGSYTGTYDLTDALHVAYLPEGVAAGATREEVLAAAQSAAYSMPVNDFVLSGSMLPGEANYKTGALVVYWPATNPNEFDNIFNLNNGRKADDDATVLKIEFGLQAEATQMMHENDSFDNTYDQMATAGKAYLNGKGYATINAALADAKPGDVITIVGGYVPMAADAASSVAVDMKGEKLTDVLLFKNAEGSNVGGTGSFDNVNLENLTVVDETFYTGENGENAWEFTYMEMGGKNTFKNVVFTDGIMVENGESTFEDCTFIGHNNDSSKYGNGTMYGAWVYSGKATFTDCTFKGTRGLKTGDYYNGSWLESVVVDNCSFGPLTEKPGVVINCVKNKDASIVIKNSTFEGVQPGDQGLYIYETDNVVPTLENNTVVGPVFDDEKPTVGQNPDIFDDPDHKVDIYDGNGKQENVKQPLLTIDVEPKNTVLIQNVNATVEGYPAVVMNQRATIVISDSTFNLDEGMPLVKNNTDDLTTMVILYNVKINGVEITNANKWDYLDKKKISIVYVYNTPMNDIDELPKLDNATGPFPDMPVFDGTGKVIDTVRSLVEFDTTERLALNVKNVKATIHNNDVVVCSGSTGAIAFSNCDFTLDEGHYLVNTAFTTMVILENVTINGKLIETREDVIPYLKGVNFCEVNND